MIDVFIPFLPQFADDILRQFSFAQESRLQFVIVGVKRGLRSSDNENDRLRMSGAKDTSAFFETFLSDIHAMVPVVYYEHARIIVGSHEFRQRSIQITVAAKPKVDYLTVSSA